MNLIITSGEARYEIILNPNGVTLSFFIISIVYRKKRKVYEVTKRNGTLDHVAK